MRANRKARASFGRGANWRRAGTRRRDAGNHRRRRDRRWQLRRLRRGRLCANARCWPRHDHHRLDSGFDLVREEIIDAVAMRRCEIPAGAVVVPGARAVKTDKGREWGLSLYAPVIVKYRDEKTDAATQLEDLLVRSRTSDLNHEFASDPIRPLMPETS